MTKQEFFAQEKVKVDAVKENPYFNVYRLKDTNQIIAEVNIESGLGGDTVELAQMTDLHLNYVIEEDYDDEEVMATFKVRKYVAGGAAAIAAENFFDAAQYADQTVLSGDILDYFTHGSVKLFKEYCLDRDRELMFCPGTHDFARFVQVKLTEKLSVAERLRLLQDVCIRNIHYDSKVIKDKVIVVTLDNSYHFYDDQAVLLKADIERARRENKVIIMFYHEPLSTLDEKQSNVEPLWELYQGARNFYSGKNIRCSAEDINDKDRGVFDLILNSSDVIKATFCGHYHSMFYSELLCPDGNRIPQYVAPGSNYEDLCGIVTWIKVK